MLRVVFFVFLLGSSLAYYKLGIGVYILNIADINVVAGSFYADYLLTIYKSEKSYDSLESLMHTFVDQDRRMCNRTGDGTFKPLNYSADDVFIVNVDRFYNFLPLLGFNASLLGQHRVMGVHYFRPQLKEWPFDTQALPIVIDMAHQVATLDVSAVVCHMPHFSGVSSSVMFPGGSSHTLDFSFNTVERCWPPFAYPDATCSGSNFGTSDCECPFVEVNNVSLGIPHSQYNDFSCRCKGGKFLASEYEFKVTYSTPESKGFQTDILPVMFIMLVNLISYVIPPEENSLRVSTCSSTLIAAVLFHSGIQSQVPPTGSLSTADVFLLVNYAVNLVSWVVTLIIVVAVNSPLIKPYRVAEHVYYATRIFGPILSLSVMPSFIIYYEQSLWWYLLLSITSGIILSTGLYIIQNKIIKKLQRRVKRSRKRKMSDDSDHFPLLVVSDSKTNAT
ncbi:uncharacterized protein LOC134183348 [Corticium candelabrum]|uniref:uncharacterized protein LOC134183348 n=1 Tax=Corticium candelabrum TaxID=121492 RepID=UPI002E256C42|nr:uncharacterized protein LOC134183348 [Corticium candelabrum]